MAQHKKTKGIRKLDNEFLSCREINHPWVELDTDHVREYYPKPSFGWLRVFLCPRCETERRDIIDTYGEVTSRSYNYPDGYQLEKWTPAKAPFRKEIARRRGVRITKTGAVQIYRKRT